MALQIIDRRLAGKNKSVGNRERFVRRYKEQIADAVRRAVSQRGIRDMEQAVLDELTQRPDCVLSTGGGAVLRPTNRENLKSRTQVVYLKSSPDELFRRLRHDTNRPLLQVADPLGRLRELYAVRDPLYREVAHFVIETGRPSVGTLVNMIVMQLELAGLLPGA